MSKLNKQKTCIPFKYKALHVFTVKLKIISNNLEPVLGNLTPVVYKDNNWVVADTSLTWYNYKNQEWANAVLLTENGKKKQ